MLNRAVISPVLMALVLATPAVAQTQPAQDAPAKNTSVGNKNEQVCENITPIGTRLATRRFCGTRAEWEDRRRQDREAVENAQRSPCVLSHNSGSGRPAC